MEGEVALRSAKPICHMYLFLLNGAGTKQTFQLRAIQTHEIKINTI